MRAELRGKACYGWVTGLLVLTAAVVYALAFVAAPASAAMKRPLKETFGSAAQPVFNADKGLAVDRASGDLLIIDSATSTVSRFKPNGEPDPFPALGTNVIDAKRGPGAKECGEEPASCDLTPQNGFSFGDANEVQVAVAPAGSAAGTAGNIYVTYASAPHAIEIFAPDGHYLGQLTKAGTTGFAEPCGVTVDGSGSVFVGDYSNGRVFKFAPSANPPTNTDNVGGFTAALDHPCTLAAGAGPSAGAVFVAGHNPLGNQSLNRPVTKLNSTTGATELVIPNSLPTTVAVDPVSGNVLVARSQEIDEYSPSGSQIGPPIELGGRAEGIAVDTNSIVYASQAGDLNVEVYGPLEQLAPEITAEWNAEVGSNEATVMAQFGLEEVGTSYRVDYGLDTSYAQSSPTSIVGPSGRVSVRLSGLQPEATYHWHIVATNTGGLSEGGDRTFTTQASVGGLKACPLNQQFRNGAASFLPNCRAYEMVSPVDKNGSGIVTEWTGSNAIAHGALDQSSAEGGDLTFSTKQAFGDAVSSPYASQYLARRGEGSWSTHGINPPREGFPGLERTPRDTEYKAFSEDLSQAWLVHGSEPPLDPPCSPANSPDLYRRDNDLESYEALHCEPNKQLNDVSTIEFQGASADGCRAVFRSNSKLTADAEPTGRYQLYESSCEGPLQVVSRLPNGSLCAKDSSAGSSPTGPEGGGDGRLRNVLHAFSGDGKRLYWSCGDTMYLRVDPDLSAAGDEETVRVSPDLCVGSICFPVPASFQGASIDGSTALLTAEGTLRRFDAEAKVLTEIAPDLQEGNILGASDDASRLYLTSTGVLTEAVNGAGVKATEGEPNLYFYEEGAGFSFIGTFSSGDVSLSSRRISPIHFLPFRRASRVTPDGLHAAFISSAPLTGYDNIDAINGEADSEVFLYDAEPGGVGKLRCISCNPSGARPGGRDISQTEEGMWAAAWIPGWQTQLYQGRPLSQDGNRLFFNSADALSSRDTNNRYDVYQWERAGSKDECIKDLGAELYVQSSGGCLSLISTGQDSEDSEFVDAGKDGSDVFIRTNESLVPQDPGLIDIYDARVNGGFPPPPPPEPECEGEACQNPPAPPVRKAPSSATFNGPSDPPIAKPPRKCPKGKHRVTRGGKSRCVSKKRKNHKRANRKSGRAVK